MSQWTTQIDERNDSRCFSENYAFFLFQKLSGSFFFSFWTASLLTQQSGEMKVHQLEWIPIEHGE